MQLPHHSLLQSRLLAYTITTHCCFAVWTSSVPHLFAYADEIPTVPEHDLLSDSGIHAFADGGLLNTQDSAFDSGESEGYEPDFAYLDRGIIGRQAAEVDKLVNDEKIVKDIGPEETLHFVLEKGQLRLRRAVDVSLDALEAQETDNASEGAVDGESVGADSGIDTHDGEEAAALRKRQSGSPVWLTANTCRQPVPGNNKTDAFKDQPQLRLFVSTSADNQKPGPGSTQNTITNDTGIVFDSGYVKFNFSTTSDVYVGISAPKLESDWFGSWNFELAASVEGPYHQYIEGDPFLYMVDTDSESTLFITEDIQQSKDSEDAKKWRNNNPFKMYAFTADDWRIAGMEHSQCALREQFNVNNTRNFTIDANVTNKFIPNNYPKAQFHVRDLENGKTYNGFVVVEGGQEPLDILRLDPIRGGGRVFQAFNWTTKVDDSCQVIFDLPFCDTVAYAVPSNTNLKLNDTILATMYDDQARAYFDNFNKSLAQIACDTTPDAQYSLARNCTDCANDYKNWLCSVLIPRCEDWTATDSWLQPRNIGSAFPNDSSMFGKDAASEFNLTARNSAAFNKSRNPLIDEEIKPGPYKEMLPCEDLCFDIVRSCPAQLGFGCPDDEQRALSYGKKDDTDNLTCSFPGAVIKLGKFSAASGLEARTGSVVVVAVMVAVFGLL